MMLMAILPSFVLLAAVLAGCAEIRQPQDGLLQLGERVQFVPPPLGEFRRSEIKGRPTIGCAMTKMEPTYQSCLRIGPLHIGQDLASVEAKIGKALRIESQLNVEVRVYAIRSTSLEDGALRLHTYWVLTYRGGIAVAIQLTGEPSTERFSFSSNLLGDRTSQLLDRFGEPSSLKRDPNLGSVYWEYSPFPFSFEIRNNTIYSIRVAEPGPSGQPFIPLPREQVLRQ